MDRGFKQRVAVGGVPVPGGSLHEVGVLTYVDLTELVRLPPAFQVHQGTPARQELRAVPLVKPVRFPVSESASIEPSDFRAGKYRLHLKSDAVRMRQVVVVPVNDHGAVGAAAKEVSLRSDRQLLFEIDVPNGVLRLDGAELGR